ncbi:MAG: hypothetical protein J6I50_07175 [Clostridia bacterium]|nr:hypothetical protein [Clostridia bacterium]
MKQKFFITLLVLCIIGIMALDFFGGVLRDYISPDVEADYPDMVDTEGQMFLRLPRSALFQNTDGDFIYILSKSEKYPEASYIANIQYIDIAMYDDLYIYIHMGKLKENDYVISNVYDSIMDGVRVHIVN